MSKIYNGGHEPLVVAWGEGVVRPGESIEVDNVESYGNPPWTIDETEAASAARAYAEGQLAPVPLPMASEAVSKPEDASQTPSQSTSGQSGRIVVQPPAAPAGANPQENV